MLSRYHKSVLEVLEREKNIRTLLGKRRAQVSEDEDSDDERDEDDEESYTPQRGSRLPEINQLQVCVLRCT
jgi:hypothetical protein